MLSSKRGGVSPPLFFKLTPMPIPDKKLPVVMVGIVAPSHFYYPQGYIVSLLTMATYSHYKEIVHGLNFTFHCGPRTVNNRNAILEDALDNCHYLLMIDTDMTFEKETLQYLIETAEANPGAVVSGLSVIGKPPFRPAIFACDFKPGERPTHIPEWPDVPFEIDVCGSFCMLIPTTVIEKLGVKAFAHIPNYYKDKEDSENRELRHDFAFCKRAKEAGIKIVCDPRVSLGHLRLYPASVEDWIRTRDRKPPKPLNV